MSSSSSTIDPELLRPVKDLKEKWKLLPCFLQSRGLVKQHIESFDVRPPTALLCPSWAFPAIRH